MRSGSVALILGENELCRGPEEGVCPTYLWTRKEAVVVGGRGGDGGWSEQV